MFFMLLVANAIILYRDAMLVGFASLILVHIVSQSVFTIGAHIREGWICEVNIRKVIFAIGTFIACVIAVAVAHRSHENVLGSAEDYLRFFVFYGLLFPGMVAAFIWTKKKFTPLRVVLFTLAALVSLPLLEAGYIGGSAWLTVIPVIIFTTWAFSDQPEPRLR